MHTQTGMKVGIVTTSFPLTRTSTSGPFILRLINHLSPGIAATVLTPSSSNSTVESQLSERHQLVCFRYAPWAWQEIAHQPGGIPVALRNNRWLLMLVPSFVLVMFIYCFWLGRRVDLIHANWSVNGAIAGLAGALTRTHVVTTLHGIDVTRAQKAWLDRLLLLLCLKLSKRVVGVSESLTEQVKSLWPKQQEKLMTIPNGVCRDLLNSTHSEVRSLEDFTIVTVCHLIPRKGVNVIIEAISRAHTRESTKFQVVGEGPELEQLKALVTSLGLESRVTFLGTVAPAHVGGILAEADLFVLASYSEGRPSALLEAMAAGVPVLASNIEGITGMIENEVNGLLFQPGNAKNLAESIDRLRRDESMRQRMAMAGRKYIISNELTWGKTAKQYAELYRAVAKPPPP